MNYREVSTEKANPLLPFIGFIVLLVTGGLSYLVAPGVAVWLTEARWVLRSHTSIAYRLSYFMVTFDNTACSGRRNVSRDLCYRNDAPICCYGYIARTNGCQCR